LNATPKLVTLDDEGLSTLLLALRGTVRLPPASAPMRPRRFTVPWPRYRRRLGQRQAPCRYG
jgi:hypothetical protein